MFRSVKSSPLVWLAIGLVGGLIVGGLWPQTPLHAVATDRLDSFAMATGPVDEDAEAVFFLDFLSGDLRAVVLGKQVGKFTAFFAHNVLNDLGVNPANNPRFMMVTGLNNLRRGAAHVAYSRSLVYVAEVTTGKVAAYALPWTPVMHGPAAGGPKPFIPLDVTRFRAAPGPVGGPVVPPSKER